MSNYSGFSGYSLSSLYPDMGSQVTDLMQTSVDPDEQSRLSAQEPDAKASLPANPATKQGLLWVFIVVVLGIFLLGWKL